MRATKDYPRIVIGATSSGSGKTTITCGLMKALINRGLKVASFKCGPDYIDTMYHSKITGTKSRNLDPYFFTDNTLRYLFANHARDVDISVIEGVMGYYDGIGMEGDASTYQVAEKTDSPAILIVNAKGASLSVLAEIEGFLNFKEDSRIRGVIFNGCSKSMYPVLKEATDKRFGTRVKALGYFPLVPEASLESRHLGLVTADEISDIEEKLGILGNVAEESLNIDGILELAKEAPEPEYEEVPLKEFSETVRIGVARDKAFCFYYEDSLEMLQRMGAELVPFSPINDSGLPENLDGLYLGGGYPELYAKELGENQEMKASLRKALEAGLPCIAECGGFMYLTETIITGVGGESVSNPMVGVIPGSTFDAGKLVRFGYIEMEAQLDNMLCHKGDKIRGHEFHHWDAENNGESFLAVKPSGKSWPCGFVTDTLYAGYPHFHFYSNPKFAENFYSACIRKRSE